MCIDPTFQPDCDVINFEVHLIFPGKPFFLHHQNIKTKYLYRENKKSF